MLPIDTESKIAALQNCSYFGGLSLGVLHELSQGTHLRSYEAGEPVCWQGENCEGLYIIRRGNVKLFKLSDKGRELIIKTFECGATFNEVPVLDNGPNVVNVATMEETQLWLVEADLIRKKMVEHPEMAQAVIINLSQNLRMLVNKVEELAFYQVTNRLARLIHQLSPDELSGTKAARITQDQMAARLGTVREVVARSLKELERSGAIQINRRQIEVVSEARLKDWVQDYDRN